MQSQDLQVYQVRALAFCRLRTYVAPVMSFTDIEAELGNLSPEELRSLALKSWTAFVKRENDASEGNECSEDDPHLLAALDEAANRADLAPDQGHSASSVRSRLNEWISK